MWLIRVGEAGNLIWSNLYGADDNYDEGHSVIEVDEGGFLVGGRTGIFQDDAQVAAWRIAENGEQIWYRIYDGWGYCYAVIELKGGEYLLAGHRNRQDRNALLMCIEADGDLLWDQEYDAGGSETFYSMRETEGGVILAGNTMSQGDGQIYVVKVNIENEGEVIWSHRYNQFNDQRGRSIVRAHDEGFIITGYAQVEEGSFEYICQKIDAEGELLWSRFYQMDNYNRGLCIERLPDDGYVIVGEIHGETLGGSIIRITSNGIQRWRSNLHNIENEEGQFLIRIKNLKSVITSDNGAIIAAGQGELEDNTRNNGVILKIEPEILNPQFISWTPPDTNLTVLPGDTVQFRVQVFDQQNDEISYLWRMGDDTLSTNPSTEMIFEELGNFDIQCRISDGESFNTITWHVRVSAWFIDSFTPDSTEITLRRGTEVDFTHQTRAIEDIEFEYNWEHFGRGGNFEFEGRDSVRYNFQLTGDHVIRASIINDDEIETIEWNVSVHSIIWWWWPHELEISAIVDTSMEFAIFPFNEEIDSHEFTWMLNNNQIDQDSSFIDLSFNETGQYEITGICREGEETDTVRWIVNVLDRNFSADEADGADLPTSHVLYPASPNPFNSSVRLKFYFPEYEGAKLTIHNIEGRVVYSLNHDQVKFGNQTFIWDCNNNPTGLYFAVLKTQNETLVRKLALVR